MQNIGIALLFLTNIVLVSTVITPTPSGNILGFTNDGVDIYLGIPYGELSTRWTPATLPLPWSNILNATSFGPICPQYGPYNQPLPYPESEQCLMLNIWVPHSVNRSLLPVRMWIHGGGYTAGNGNDYDGENLARLSQSIIITINYRLGIFGYFPLPQIETRNVGWLDQQLALQWIQDNIKSFGGNQSNVMLFGQSAGGGSVLAHLTIPSSWPLYSSVILQSAGPYRYADCQISEKENFQILQNAFPQCGSNISCFQQLNVSLFYEKISINWIKLWPCIGTRSQLQDQPLALFRKGEYNRQVSIMGGINYNEGQSSILTFNSFQITINASQYRPFAESYAFPETLIDMYDPTTKDKDYFTALTWLFGDYYLHCPITYLFNHLTQWSSSNYAYFFTHPTENWAFTPFHFNATHLTEIPYVFHNQFAFSQLTPAETNLSLAMVDLFTKFHSNIAPWSSFGSNQSVLVFDLFKNNQFITQSGFTDRLNTICPMILKYIDSDDCHGYFTEKECSTLKHCQWINNHCEE